MHIIESAPTFTSAHFFLRWLSLSIFLAAIDQAVKLSVIIMVPLNSSVEVASFFNLTHRLNTGAAFSLLASAGGWQRHFFTLFGILVSMALLYLLKRGVHNRLETVGFVSIIGGALGNVVDRLRIGAVVDFLDFHWQAWHWPAFNLADVFIITGVGLVLLASFRLPRSQRSAKIGDSLSEKQL